MGLLILLLPTLQPFRGAHDISSKWPSHQVINSEANFEFSFLLIVNERYACTSCINRIELYVAVRSNSFEWLRWLAWSSTNNRQHTEIGRAHV